MKAITTLLFFCATFNLYAQTTRDSLLKDYGLLLGNYSVYKLGNTQLTPTPDGYEPFYISHYARHGSRFLISNKTYRTIIPFMEKADSANQLTPLGKIMLVRLRRAYAYSKGKSGELSPLGGIQHEHIARRMYENYPEIFQTGNTITAYASYVDRSTKSMNHFCDVIRHLNKNLDIKEYNGNEYSYFIRPNHDSIAYTPEQKAFKERIEDVEDSLRKSVNISSLLFKDPSYVTKNKQKHYSIAYYFFDAYKSSKSMPEADYGFNLFTEDQLFTYFKWTNINWMERSYLIPGEPPFYKRAYATLRNMISLADEAISQNKGGATLRFGHDTFLMPLAYVMGLDGCTNFPAEASKWEDFYKHFVSSEVVPMAGNIQMVFYKPKKGTDFLVKILLQEKETHIPVKTDMWPYYHWNDVREYYLNYMNKINPIEYVKKGKYSKTREDEINT